VLQQRRGEGAVAVLLAVERGGARIGGEGDQDARGRLRLDRGQAAGDRARPGGELGREGVVAAGVEDEHIDPLVALHLAQDELHVDGAEVEVGLGLQRGVDGDEIVLVAHRDAVPGIIDDAGLGAVELLGEFADDPGHLVHAQVVALDDLETEALQRGRDRGRVALRVGEARDRRVGAVADDQRDAPLGHRLCGQGEEQDGKAGRNGREGAPEEAAQDGKAGGDRRTQGREAHGNLPDRSATAG
jgi:hypothetical protein